MDNVNGAGNGLSGEHLISINSEFETVDITSASDDAVLEGDDVITTQSDGSEEDIDLTGQSGEANGALLTEVDVGGGEEVAFLEGVWEYLLPGREPPDWIRQDDGNPPITEVDYVTPSVNPDDYDVGNLGRTGVRLEDGVIQPFWEAPVLPTPDRNYVFVPAEGTIVSTGDIVVQVTDVELERERGEAEAEVEGAANQVVAVLGNETLQNDATVSGLEADRASAQANLNNLNNQIEGGSQNIALIDEQIREAEGIEGRNESLETRVGETTDPQTGRNAVEEGAISEREDNEVSNEAGQATIDRSQLQQDRNTAVAAVAAAEQEVVALEAEIASLDVQIANVETFQTSLEGITGETNVQTAENARAIVNDLPDGVVLSTEFTQAVNGFSTSSASLNEIDEQRDSLNIYYDGSAGEEVLSVRGLGTNLFTSLNGSVLLDAQDQVPIGSGSGGGENTPTTSIDGQTPALLGSGNLVVEGTGLSQQQVNAYLSVDGGIGRDVHLLGSDGPGGEETRYIGELTEILPDAGAGAKWRVTNIRPVDANGNATGDVLQIEDYWNVAFRASPEESPNWIRDDITLPEGVTVEAPRVTTNPQDFTDYEQHFKVEIPQYLPNEAGDGVIFVGYLEVEGVLMTNGRSIEVKDGEVVATLKSADGEASYGLEVDAETVLTSAGGNSAGSAFSGSGVQVNLTAISIPDNVAETLSEGSSLGISFNATPGGVGGTASGDYSQSFSVTELATSIQNGESFIIVPTGDPNSPAQFVLPKTRALQGEEWIDLPQTPQISPGNQSSLIPIRESVELASLDIGELNLGDVFYDVASGDYYFAENYQITTFDGELIEDYSTVDFGVGEDGQLLAIVPLDGGLEGFDFATGNVDLLTSDQQGVVETFSDAGLEEVADRLDGLDQAEASQVGGDLLEFLFFQPGSTPVVENAVDEWLSDLPPDVRETLDRDAIIELLGPIAEPLAGLAFAAQANIGDPEARAQLESIGVEFDENGWIIPSEGMGRVSTIVQRAIESNESLLTDPELNSAVVGVLSNDELDGRDTKEQILSLRIEAEAEAEVEASFYDANGDVMTDEEGNRITDPEDFPDGTVLRNEDGDVVAITRSIVFEIADFDPEEGFLDANGREILNEDGTPATRQELPGGTPVFRANGGLNFITHFHGDPPEANLEPNEGFLDARGDVILNVQGEPATFDELNEPIYYADGTLNFIPQERDETAAPSQPTEQPTGEPGDGLTGAELGVVEARASELEGRGLSPELAYQTALVGDPALTAHVLTMRADGASDAEIAAVIGAVQSGVPLDEIVEMSSGTSSVSEWREATQAEIERLKQVGPLGGNEAAIAFLESFDLILGGIDLTGGDFSAAEISAFFEGNSDGIGFLMEALGAGDAEAWAAVSNDLGVFGASLTDGQRDTLVEYGRGLNVAGGYLTLASMSGEELDDALWVSGGLISAGGDALLAAAGEEVAGFEGNNVPVAYVLINRFAGIAAPYAAETETVWDDIGVEVLEEGPGVIHAFSSPDVFEFIPAYDELGNELFGPADGELLMKVDASKLGTGLAINLGATIGQHLIDGFAGDLVGGVGRTVGNQFLVSAGAMTPTQAIIAGVMELANVIGIDIPPEVQMGALIALAAVNASNPVGWVALGVQVVFQLMSMRDWTEVSVFRENIDADGDGEAIDTAFLSRDMSSDFWGRVSVEDGRYLYEVVSPNGALLQEATFDLALGTNREMTFSERHIEVDGYADNRETETFGNAVIIEGHRVEGTIIYPDDTGRNGLDNAIIPKGETVQATFVPDEGALDTLIEQGIVLPDAGPIPITVTRRQNVQYKDWDGSGGLENITDLGLDYELSTQWKTENLAPSLEITPTYGDLNPNTGGETETQYITLTPEEYDRILADLGGQTGQVTLQGADPLFQPGPDGQTSGIYDAMQNVTVTFDAEDRNPDFYTYMDVNGDGNPDLVRYGTKADNDGLGDGDRRYEITLMGPDLQPLGLPTIRHTDLNHASHVAQLTPYLMQWGATRPELGQYGQDPMSLYNLAAEEGDLAGIEELYDIDLGFALDMNQMQGLLESGEVLDDAAWEGLEFEMQPETPGRRDALVADLGLLDTAAYADANPGLRSEIAATLGLPEELIGGSHLAHHYLVSGNAEGRSIDPAGLYLDVGTTPVRPQSRSAGNELWAGEELRAGEQLISENGQFAAEFTLGGDLVIRDLTQGHHPVIWETNNGGEATDHGGIVMQPDGDLVVYDNDGAEFHHIDAGFSSGTSNGATHGAFVLRLENDGRLVIRDRTDNSVLWVAGQGQNEHGNDIDNNGRGFFVRAAPTVTDLPAPTDSANANRDAILFTKDGALTYLASDPALMTQWRAEGGDPVLWARNQFITTGQGGEVALNPNLVDLYLAAPGNDDLVMAFRDDPGGALEHYVTTGVGEVADGTRGSLALTQEDTPNAAYLYANDILETELGALEYLAANPGLAADVMAGGDDPITAARAHFRAVGWNPDHGMNFDFDVDSYLSAPGNGDLMIAYANDPIGAMNHYLMIGASEFAEGTRADLDLGDDETENTAALYYEPIMETDSGALAYLASNPELATQVMASGEDPISEARSDFLESGWNPNSGRSFDFSPASYISAPGNDDLVIAFGEDPEGATRHFLEIGMGEIEDGTRQYGQREDGVAENATYVTYNDIMESNEGAYTYLASNPGLIDYAHENGIEDLVTFARDHFVDFGWSEGRSMDFDVDDYLSAPENADLARVFGQNNTAGVEHFVTTGYHELDDPNSNRVAARDPNSLPSNTWLYRDNIMTTQDGALAYINANPGLLQDAINDNVDLVDRARGHFMAEGWKPSYGMNFAPPQPQENAA